MAYEKHLTILAILHIGLSALWLLIGAVVFFAVVGGGFLSGDSEAIAITSMVGSVLAGFFFLIGVPGIIGGIGLLKRASWSRILVLVLGFLNLFNFPHGTLLGIYTIWVLMQDEAQRYFEPSSPSIAPAAV